MGTLKTFEELDIWKKGMEITMKVYELSSTGFFSKDYALKTQIRDACISITSNIAEGYERDGVKEQIQFLYYAKGSAGEVRSQLHTAKKIELHSGHRLL